MKTQIETQTKIEVAVQVLTTDKTKAEISREFGVSARSVGRWAEQFKEEAEKVILKQSKEAQELQSGISAKAAKILADYEEKKNQNLKPVDRRFKRGATKKGTKSIRQTVLEIMDARKSKGELTKANRVEITQEISDAIGHEYQRCNWYFLVYKNILGGYQD